LAKRAGDECFKNSIYDREDIGLLIYTGVHKSGFIFEPAIAAMLAGDLKINDSLKNGYNKETFAFDLVNGAVGWLNACYVANRMIQAKSTRRAMLLAAEVENNSGFSECPPLGLEETASAVIIEESVEKKIGFSNFVFKGYTEYLDEYHTYLSRNCTKVYVELRTNGHFEDYMIDCISKTVRILLKTTGKEIADFKSIIPPQISPRFISKLANVLEVKEGKLIQEMGNNSDLYTSSIPYGIYHAQKEKKVSEGDIGLIIGVGSGIQVGCAVYHF
jgi:3-oxoacyl-[acyl-carrier-protein] synthase III